MNTNTNTVSVSLYFRAQGNVKQDIELFSPLTRKQFAEGMAKGKYATTLSHDDVTPSQIMDIETGEFVGVVTAQESLEDMEFDGYEIVKN